jgi:hypothetical protein
MEKAEIPGNTDGFAPDSGGLESALREDTTVRSESLS